MGHLKQLELFAALPPDVLRANTDGARCVPSRQATTRHQNSAPHESSTRLPSPAFPCSRAPPASLLQAHAELVQNQPRRRSLTPRTLLPHASLLHPGLP